MNGRQKKVKSQKSKVKSEEGFTLVELVIVLSILGIIMTFAEPVYKNSVTKAKEAALKKDLYIIRENIDQYYADNNQYPAVLEDLVEKKYIRTVPVDPFTKSRDTWVVISSAIESTDVFDIKSGSDLVGLDGTPYNEW